MNPRATRRITESFLVRELPGRARGGRPCVLTAEPLEYRVGSADSDELIVVPAGFETDFASVPWPLWNLFPPIGAHARPAIIHDYLYRTLGLRGRYTRQRCDGIFREAMAVVGVPPWRRWLMWKAVDLFGWRGWGS